jgi:hypothetical protein
MEPFRELTDKDIERATEAWLAESRDLSHVVRLKYDKNREMIDFYYRCGAVISIPRRKVPGLQRKGPLPGPITLSDDAVSCRALDVDVHIPGLIDHVFGPRFAASMLGTRGGRQKSAAKTRAVRRNARLGGRPRKQAVA